MSEPDQWDKPQNILVVLAHPDDPDFFCGATIAKWAASGHHITYCLLTCGDKGTHDLTIVPGDLCALRQAEQRAAAAVLGVECVFFLGYPDGYLVADLDLRKAVTRVIRQERPDILVTCDPLTLYSSETRLNHPDHRAAGQAALDAVFPAARDYLNFPELYEQEHLEPWIVREVWVSGTQSPNVKLDITAFWGTKINAILQHKSQITDATALVTRMNERRDPESTPENPRFEETFRRLVIG
jgi:LmbE family N-acetylglucosaminyl deacetylase